MKLTELRQIIKEELKETYSNRNAFKSVKSDKYKHVSLRKDSGTGKEIWVATLTKQYNPKEGTGWVASFDNERDAAIAVDKKLLAWGKEPVNILKKK
jgi:hypothetical protein